VVEFFDEVIEDRQRAIADQNAFKIVDHALVIYGDCLQGEECPRRAALKRGS
jgi:Fur family ferric uptake transcriptional regulator